MTTLTTGESASPFSIAQDSCIRNKRLIEYHTVVRDFVRCEIKMHRRVLNEIIQIALWLSVVCLIPLSYNCSPPAQCTGPISQLTINPSKGSCTKDCECNNQRYTGFCKEGLCTSVKRLACGSTGDIQPCIGLKNGCTGRRTCKPETLTSQFWGDCVCDKKGEESSWAEKPSDASVEPIPETLVDAPPENTPADKLPPEPHIEKQSEILPEVLSEQPPEGPVQGSEGKRALHQSCQPLSSAPLSHQCKPGLLCHRATPFKVTCQQDCSKDPTVCQKNTDGRTYCLQVGWDSGDKPISICAKVAQKGQGCDHERGVYCKRDPISHSVCRAGKCIKASLRLQQGDSCAPDAVEPAVCALEKHLYCDQKGKCKKGIKRLEGERCSGSDCPKGLQCMPFDRGAVMTCVKKCDSPEAKKACESRPSFSCKTTSGTSLCFQSGCTTAQDCLLVGWPHKCVSSAGFQKKACLPENPGERRFGEKCKSTNNTKERCAPRLTCSQLTDLPHSKHCNLTCENTTDCQVYHPKATCLNLSLKQKICMFTCSKDQDCPFKWTCQRSGNTTRCAPAL